MITGKKPQELIEQHVAEWIRLTREKDARQPQEKPLVITISREEGAGAEEIADLLRGKLGAPWQIWDREIIDEIQKNTRIQREMLESLDEKTKNSIESFVDSFATDNLHLFGMNEYKRNLIKVLLHIGKSGHAIILGRGANFILEDSFRVRIVASRWKRVDMLGKRDKINPTKALSIVRDSDHERERFIRQDFGATINEAFHYDLCIKTNYITPATAAEMIYAGAKDKLRF